jgi:hypothetical protein
MSDKFLSNSNQAGVYYLPASRLGAIEKTAKSLHLKNRHLEITPGQVAGAVLVQIGKILHFPEWYGANFDALRDCLTDPECLPGIGHILTISGSESLRDSDPEGFTTLLEVLVAAADERRQTDTPLWILLDRPAPGIRSLPKA